jgi:hypothetical protein
MHFIDPSHPMKPPLPPAITEDEYLRMEEKAKTKHEFRNGGVWAIGPTLTRMEDTVRLRSLEMDLPLADIYAEVVLPSVPSTRAAEV